MISVSSDDSVFKFAGSSQAVFTSDCTIFHFYQLDRTFLPAFGAINVLDFDHYNRCAVVRETDSLI